MIGVYTDKSGKAYPGMKLISKLSGYSRLERVRQGIGFLRGAGLIEKQRVGRRNEYRPKGNALWLRGSYFPIYKDVIRRGDWARLTPSEKAVFLTLAVKATINDPAVERESNQHGIGVFWPSTIARLSGITRMSFYRAVNGLIAKGWMMAISEAGELLGENQPTFYAGNGYIVYQKPIAMQKEAESIFSEKIAIM